MTLDEFWDLIEATRQPEAKEHAARLVEQLAERSVDDIFSFANHWGDMSRAADRWDLWGAAYFIIGGCSNDGFLDFRTGLILRGKPVYETVLDNPDNLVDVPGVERLQIEAYVPFIAYEKKTGRDDFIDELHRRFPPPENLAPRKPAGEKWDFDDRAQVRKRFPRLVDKYLGNF